MESRQVFPLQSLPRLLRGRNQVQSVDVPDRNCASGTYRTVGLALDTKQKTSEKNAHEYSEDDPVDLRGSEASSSPNDEAEAGKRQ